MFVNGEYTPAEQNLLNAFNSKAAGLTGWAGEAEGKTLRIPLNIPTADYTLFRIMARSYDAKNPLYSSRAYASESKWGKTIAPPLFLLNVAQFSYLPFDVPAEVGTVLSVQTGSDYHWQIPVREGDNLRVFCEAPRVEDITPTGEQGVRTLSICYTNRYYNQDTQVGTISHIQQWTYDSPGADKEEFLRTGYELSQQTAFLKKDIRTTESYVYSVEQANALQDFYEGEPRRGDLPLLWDEVNVGDELPSTLTGPITEWDQVAAVGSSAERTLTMMEIRQRYPEKLIYDEYGVPHHRNEIYLSKTVPKISNRYSSEISEQTIGSAMLRTVSNWMGDDGFICSFTWRELAKVCLCDTILANGRVTRKYHGAGGELLVDLDLNIMDIRGYVSHAGTATVCLPGSGLGDEQTAVAAISLQNGTRFRISEYAPWSLGPHHPLAGRTGRIVEQLNSVPGYAYALLDDDCTGLDPRVVVGVATNALEKL